MSTGICIHGDYQQFIYNGKVGSCEEHVASSESAIYEICTSPDYKKHCCETCASIGKYQMIHLIPLSQSELSYCA